MLAFVGETMDTGPEVRRLEAAALRFRTQGRMGQAYPLYARAAELAEAADPDEASKLWGRAGACALDAGHADAAAACLRRAVDLVSPDHLDRHGRLTRLYGNLTAALYQGSRIRESWDAGRQALLLAEEGGRPRAVAQALYNLGLAERYLGAFDEAAKLFREARAIYLDAGAASRAADALHNLGWVQGDRGDLEAAEAALRQAWDEKVALGEPVARIQVELARLQLLRGGWVRSLMEALEVIETTESLTDPETYLQALVVAAAAARADDLAVALGYARMAVDLATSLGRPPVLLDLLPLVVRLHAEADQVLDSRVQALAVEVYARRHGLYAPTDRLLTVGPDRRKEDL